MTEEEALKYNKILQNIIKQEIQYIERNNIHPTILTGGLVFSAAGLVRCFTSCSADDSYAGLVHLCEELRMALKDSSKKIR